MSLPSFKIDMEQQTCSHERQNKKKLAKFGSSDLAPFARKAAGLAIASYCACALGQAHIEASLNRMDRAMRCLLHAGPELGPS